MVFQSAFREREEAFLQFKIDFGRSYVSQSHYLAEFDRFCLERYPDVEQLTEEIVMSWSVIKPTETSNGYVTRISVIRQFGKFLSMTGENAFILPSGLKGGGMPQMPYVFTSESLENFFGFVDDMPRAYRSPVRHLILPVMFRYMYCCGLRPSEARNLRRQDVNLRSGRIFIRESKHYKEREIYVLDDLAELTEEYLYEISMIFPETEALFPGRSGSYISYSAQQDQFQLCRSKAGISGYGTKEPNLYSFRHTFATHRIYKWHKEGRDIGSLIPALSAYMGHTSFQHTLYYLHFIPELFADLSGFDFELFSDLLPEVDGDE